MSSRKRGRPATEVGTAFLALLIVASNPGPVKAQQRPPAAEMARIVESVEELDRLRSQLAGAFLAEGVRADQRTFEAVCKPVKMRSLSLSEDRDWKIRQLAVKYRNPDHAAGAEARQALELLDARPEVEGLWVRGGEDGRSGFRYYRRITVEEACLACHGSESERPQFVKDNYPDDRAFGFVVGDLRGVYSVFVASE